ncbi:MAG: translation elongation factor 4 [Planctomycetota bacterium]|nr:translation elongation factor 4 [Planctomycetota bacterium]MCX8040337.1 translation elongation factor 4 [Planctomycetota bacterium]MDW8373793.1 translation elongation factor 4 [Planctomycetota bacterium]
MPHPQDLIRDFCIIAHIDHGKSTLAERLLERCGAMAAKEDKELEVLDNLELERERGITIKAKAVTLDYRHRDGRVYQLNLIDTPGHVDFSYEVTRSLQACEGCLLVVDASQGVQAQTVANYLLADQLRLAVVPVINKIDLPSARPEVAKAEIEESLALPAEHAILASAKAGIGIDEILEAVVRDIPPPAGDRQAPLQALIFDAIYDDYRGIILYVRVKNGWLRRGDRIRLIRSERTYEVTDIGRLRPQMESSPDGLAAGEVGYVCAAIKALQDVKVGDTITDAERPAEPLPGFRELKPMVYCGLYPAGDSTYDQLREAVQKLSLNDASFVWTPESGGALGHGFRCGFLGMLHMEICQERLEREHDLDMVQTAPTVTYRVRLRGQQRVLEITTPSELPREGYEAIEEPMVEINFLVPAERIGAVMQLAQDRRGRFLRQDWLGQHRCRLAYRMPLAEVIFDLFDRLKSLTQGYGTMDYEFCGYEEADLVKVDILVHNQPCEALAFICHRSVAERRGRAIIKRLKEEIPRHLFEIALQAAIGSRVIARETIKSYGKNVTAKCYGGDITRKRKLLEKQKEGKKRMKMIGSVEVPQAAFLSVLKAQIEDE